jgi:ABC-type nitrate/sulfonate/bicarbonate transport system permease component
MRRTVEIIALFIGIMLIPAIWIGLKIFDFVPDRFLPSPQAVFLAYQDIEPNIFIHFISTALRLFVGFSVGIALGMTLGIFVNMGRVYSRLILPSLQAIRAIPAVATVLFFLLWFGFSETGRLLLVVLTVSTNVGIASYQILAQIPDKYAVFFHTFKIDRRKLILDYSLPMIILQVLPTLRFSLALVIGAQTVSELLGAQIGLGYVIQSARSTLSLPALFLAILLLGLITVVSDFLLCFIWRKLVYWKQEKYYETSK